MTENSTELTSETQKISFIDSTSYKINQNFDIKLT